MENKIATSCAWHRFRLALGVLALFSPIARFSPNSSIQGQEQRTDIPADSPRRTDIVRLIERCSPAVVSIRNVIADEKPGTFRLSSGSGSIVHPSGFILTNYHVVRSFVRGEAILADGRVFPYQVVSAFPPDDLALIRIQVPVPLKAMPIGRSHDLMLGEPALVIGNPDGLVQSVSTGIISGLSRSVSTPDAFLPWMVQTTAAINGGNSGGPLVNALGQQIGLITSKNQNADNIGFAIAIDRVRQKFANMVAAEERFAFQLGLEVEMLTGEATVKRVVAGSPAENAEIRMGDVVRRLGGFDIGQGLDFHLALIGRKAGEVIELSSERDHQLRSVPITLNPLPLMDPVADEGLSPGLDFAAYEGNWTELPSFEPLTPAEKGIAQKPSTASFGQGKDHFGLTFTGYIKLPADGLYAFFTKSDDGSQLRIGDRLVVDNDGLHPALETAGLIRMKGGVYPLDIRFFEGLGSETLQVSIEGPGIPKQEIPENMLWRRKSEIRNPKSETDSETEIRKDGG